ncbi:fanconi-associated nuclease 1 homolog isoform X1 [Panicum hallii]|uniref:fanconi-associated nuclease 1 homolog isoform X1 n=1 Tax=Panicum hallii TaxID=206008 RepID=UPI000DF4E43B|nr:fanconi-associated nuclease 1 homolog isoform X1 [Panicum hallii]
MLTGRESLVRLIGRRRRSPLPASLAAVLSPSSPFPAASTAQADDGGGSGEAAGAEAGPSSGGSGGVGVGAEWVSCPVCGESIRGSDYCVNTHLDICLTRGTKRKLTQSTLLNFRFSRKVSAEPASNNLKNEIKTESEKQIDEDLSRDQTFFSLDIDIEGSKAGASISSPGCLNGSLGISKMISTYVPSNTLLPNVKDAVSNVPVEHCSSSMFPTVATSRSIDACADLNSSTIIAVDTVIVGRRFHEDIELREDAGITFQRDPQNAKDSDAIKVLYAASECEEMLGYLPRELAKVLAPLMDRQYVECEGYVVGLPEQQLGNVPIQITVQKYQRNDDPKYLQSLWEKFISTIKSGNFQRPTSARYQKNFNLMISDVIANHTHVFSDIEKSFLASFKSLSDDGQCLFVRIYTRKGPWFRKSTILYREILDLEHAAMELKLAGYIDMLSCTVDPSEYDMKEILDVLSVPEMKEILKELQKSIYCLSEVQPLPKHWPLERITQPAHVDTSLCAPFCLYIIMVPGTCIRISKMADELLWRIQRLFFLNGDQDLSSFLLVEFGVVKFPDYACSISHRLFQERSDLLEYEEAIRVAQVMDESLDNNNMDLVTRCIDLSENRLCAMSKQENATSPEHSPSFFSCFSSSWVYSKILTLGVSVYERDRRYEDAIRILKILLSKIACDRRRGYWTLRLSVDLEHMGRPNESLSIAEGGVIDPWVRAGSKFALQRRVLRLSKPPRRWKIPSYADYVKRNIKEVNIEGRPLNCETGAKNLFYGYDGELCGVEQLALQYYADEGGGWQGTHSEGGIWMTIFGLLMWGVMFSDIQDVFQSKFQMAPLDLETDDFYKSRKDLAESQLKKIQDGMAEEMLISSWELHQGTSCHGVNWDRHSLTDLRAVVACIGGHRLALLLRHLAIDYRSWSSGMPDLLLWRFLDERGGGEAKLVEVKGPRDQLSEQQRAWILVLMDFGFDVEVCKVSPVAKRR